MQVVIVFNLSTELRCQTIDAYRALRYLNPSLIYITSTSETRNHRIFPRDISSRENGVVTIRSLAGTRPRGNTYEEDVLLEKELLADPKELAEHLMLIDLGRNDIGKICEIGSVEVIQKMVVERYSHVMHISSTVEGRLKKHLTS